MPCAKLFPYLIFAMEANQFHRPHLVSAETFDRYPLNWDAIFLRQAPLAVEIGFGNGEFMVDWATRRPEWNFVGIDSSRGSVLRLQKGTLKNSIGNVRILQNDAPFCLRELFSNNSIQHLVMNFPDPWPKIRHKERRMLQPSFILTLGAVLTNKGMFELVTDQQWLARDSHAMFSRSDRFFQLNALEKNPERSLRTKYEKKWQEAGCDLYHLTAIKIKEIAISRILEDCEMPHRIIENEISAEQIIPLTDFEYEAGNHLFVIKEVYGNFKKKGYLLRVISKDFNYKQVFYIVVSRRETEWLIKLDETCPVFRTPAVKLAVNKLAEVLSRDP